MVAFLGFGETILSIVTCFRIVGLIVTLDFKLTTGLVAFGGIFGSTCFFFDGTIGIFEFLVTGALDLLALFGAG